MQKFKHQWIKFLTPFAILLGIISAYGISASGKTLRLHKNYELEKISFFTQAKREVHFYGNKLEKYITSDDFKSRVPNSYQTFFNKYSLTDHLRPYWYHYCKNEQEASQYALKKNSPRLTWKNGRKLPDGKYVFVLKNGVLYAGLKIDKADPEKNILRFGHSSFFRGGDVDSAGKLYIKNSDLYIVDNISGHYKPEKENLIESIIALDKLGTDFSKSRILLFDTDDHYTEIAGVRTPKSVKKFLQELKVN